MLPAVNELLDLPDERITVQSRVLLAEYTEILPEEKSFPFHCQDNTVLVSGNFHKSCLHKRMRPVQQCLPLPETDTVSLIHIVQSTCHIGLSIPVTMVVVIAHLIKKRTRRQLRNNSHQVSHQRHPTVVALHILQELTQSLGRHIAVLYLRVHQPAEIVSVKFLG